MMKRIVLAFLLMLPAISSLQTAMDPMPPCLPCPPTRPGGGGVVIEMPF